MSLDIVSLRDSIDDLDTRIAELLHERIIIARAIVQSKKQKGLLITDNDRERLIIDRVCNLVAIADRDSIERIYAEIFREAKK